RVEDGVDLPRRRGRADAAGGLHGGDAPVDALVVERRAGDDGLLRGRDDAGRAAGDGDGADGVAARPVDVLRVDGDAGRARAREGDGGAAGAGEAVEGALALDADGEVDVLGVGDERGGVVDVLRVRRQAGAGDELAGGHVGRGAAEEVAGCVGEG